MTLTQWWPLLIRDDTARTDQAIESATHVLQADFGASQYDRRRCLEMLRPGSGLFSNSRTLASGETVDNDLAGPPPD